jgi:hypothetical protein
MTYLCDNNMCGIAWLLVAIVPIFFITIAIIRKRKAESGKHVKWSEHT